MEHGCPIKEDRMSAAQYIITYTETPMASPGVNTSVSFFNNDQVTANQE
jgi:hypothetical protein